MSHRAWLVLAVGVLLAIGAVLLAGGSVAHRAHTSGRPAALAPLAPARMSQLRASARAGRRRIVAAVSPHSAPEHVARAFVLGWLACTYHERACTSIPGTLPAYQEALGREHARSLPTPAERLARPRVVRLQAVRACQRSATATVTYQDGEGGRFQLHLSLVDVRAVWKVFDVAEAAPHIPLPAELNHGPGRC